MLAELLLTLATPAPRPTRRLGLVGDSVALWSRARRQRSAWAEHERRCHAVVERAMQGLERRRTALVLGSGLLRDIPVERLMAGFERVVLADAVHPLSVRRRFRGAPNVRLVDLDLTGAAAWLTDRGGQACAFRRDDPLASFREDPELDLAVSANVLSQLPFAPERWLERRPALAARLGADFPDQLMRLHLDDLAGLPCRVCLLTDVEMRRVARNGGMEERTDLLPGLTLPPPDDAWDWTVAPFGEAGRGFALVHRVQAYADLAAARSVAEAVRL